MSTLAQRKLEAQIPLILVPSIVGGAIRGRLTLQPGSVMTDNEHGIDTLVRTFFGFTDEMYKLAPKKGDKDKWIPSMRCTDRSFVEDRGLTGRVQCTYRGLLDDTVPDVVVKGGWAEQTVTLSVTTGLGGNTGGIILGGDFTGADNIPTNVDQNSEVAITYRAPHTSFLYITRRRPIGPRYTGQLLLSVGDFSVVEMRPSRLRGRPMGILVVRCVSFDVETAGSYWQCAEMQQSMIIPVDADGLKNRVAMVSPFPLKNIRTR